MAGGHNDVDLKEDYFDDRGISRILIFWWKQLQGGKYWKCNRLWITDGKITTKEKKKKRIGLSHRWKKWPWAQRRTPFPQRQKGLK